MELEKSNDMQDRTQQITEMEVAKEVLSQVTGGGAQRVTAMVVGGGATGAFLGAGVGAIVKGNKESNIRNGAGIGAAVGALAGTAAAHKEFRTPRMEESAIEMAHSVPR